ncbi:metal ABC transporter permease [Modestobacter muralis]
MRRRPAPVPRRPFTPDFDIGRGAARRLAGGGGRRPRPTGAPPQRDLVVFAVMAVVVLSVTVGLSRHLFTVGLDAEYAAASGLPVLRLDLLLAVVTAGTVTLSMRVLGLLLISALMVLPAGCAQLVGRSSRSSLAIAVAVGLTASVTGTVLSFYADTPSGATIVLVTVAVFALLAAGRTATRAPARWHHPDRSGGEPVPAAADRGGHRPPRSAPEQMAGA